MMVVVATRDTFDDGSTKYYPPALVPPYHTVHAYVVRTLGVPFVIMASCTTLDAAHAAYRLLTS